MNKLDSKVDYWPQNSWFLLFLPFLVCPQISPFHFPVFSLGLLPNLGPFNNLEHIYCLKSVVPDGAKLWKLLIFRFCVILRFSYNSFANKQGYSLQMNNLNMIKTILSFWIHFRVLKRYPDNILFTKIWFFIVKFNSKVDYWPWNLRFFTIFAVFMCSWLLPCHFHVSFSEVSWHILAKSTTWNK